MEHLTFDEIVGFVSVTEINEETLELVTKVTEHICECQDCYKLVKSIQMMYDEFIHLETEISFCKYVKVITSKDNDKNDDIDLLSEKEEMDY